MTTARTAKTVVYVSGATVALTAIVGAAAVGLTGSGSPATPRPVAADTAPAPSAAPAHHKDGVPVARPAAHPTTTASANGTTKVTPAALKVPPRGPLTPPDAIVTVPRSVSPHAVARLRRDTGIRRVAVADRGHIRIHHVKLRVLGVPLASIRGFLPSLTASSRPLWQSVARGELTVAYANAHGLRRHLGATYVASGPHAKSAPLRIGAFATIGLTGTQAMVSRPEAAALGLARDRQILVAAPKIPLATLHRDLVRTLGSKAHIQITRVAPVDQSLSSTYAVSTIPATYLDLYRRAAVTCPGLPWTVLAAIGTVETGNGRDVHKSSAGAEGPMQFLPSTWAMYGYDADGDGKADINDPTDAVFSAARYLCAAGAGRAGQSLDNAIFSYNHAWWYVREVINIANRYA
jgi:hypothetical protein